MKPCIYCLLQSSGSKFNIQNGGLSCLLASQNFDFQIALTFLFYIQFYSGLHLSPPGGLGCCPFYGGGSVVDDLLFDVLPIVFGLLCIILCPF